MSSTRITRKQFAATILLTLLSPLFRALPRAAVQLAGKGAWLSFLPAGLILLALAAFMGILRRCLRPGEGLAALFLRWLGPVFGRAALLLYALWFLFYAGFILRSGAERLVGTVYPNSPLILFVLLTLALCLIVALGNMRAIARTAVLLRSLLLWVLVLIFLFVLSNVETKNLFPLFREDAGGILKGAWPIFTVGAVPACFAFLSGYVEEPKGSVRWILPSLLIFLALAGILCLTCTGAFGAVLTTRLSHPFFTMVRDISFRNISQRIEAVVIVLWIFADFVLCTVLLRCAHEAIRAIFSLPEPDDHPLMSFGSGRWLIWAEAALILTACFCLTPSSFELLKWSDRIIPLIGDGFIYIGLPLIWLVGKLRKRA